MSAASLKTSSQDEAEVRHEASHLPLSDITVLDLTLARAGPTCVRHLSDWGAEVIRIEAPDADPAGAAVERDSSDAQNLHRGKRSIRLNLKSKAGHEVFMRLAAKADVIVENMRADVKHRLGISWEDVSAVNPRLVYGSISGFGQDGIYANRPGVDQIAQGMGGLMSITGLPGQGPVRVGIPIADLTAGNLLALAILMALFDRQRTGAGRWVYTSLLESQIFMLDFQATRWLIDGIVPGQAGNDHPTAVATGVFPTSDGAVNIAAHTPRLWSRLCDALDKPNWINEPKWATDAARTQDRAAINSAIGEVTRRETSAHWVGALECAGVPCGPINSIDQVFEDPQVKHLAMATPVYHPRLGELELIASAIGMTGAGRRIRQTTPDIGEHSSEILSALGYSADDIARLASEGAI